MTKTLTEQQAIAIVHQRGRYFQHGFRLPNGETGGRYAVDYNEQVFHSNDTRALVKKLLRYANRQTKA
jgi:hypothetical protein